ncbi:MAG: hypothetical protein KC420_20460, partial [Myxococcales bacterium]|nr:hypothetical protein [Myxococcales bacterium]
VDHGVALHFGDVMFGNIGAPHRLDFTVIGPAVNLAARLEARCAPLGVRLVMSAAFAGRCAARTIEAERVVLKGVGEQAVYVLADDPV